MRRLKLLVIVVAVLAGAQLASFQAVFAGSNTYPAPWAPPTAQDSMFDSWGEYNRECTSYASWMLHSVNGFEMPFHNDAYAWGTEAAAPPYNYTVNMTPAVGSIYWKAGTGQYHTGQHVAWVESVSGSNVTIEDYNSDYTGHWNEYSVATSSASGYIHFKDIGGNVYTGVGSATYTGGNSMANGTTMLPGYYLASNNVQGALIFQTDSNLVLYYGGNAVWQSGTSGGNANRLVMQTDGNLVMYRADNSVVWQSGTGGHQGAAPYATLQDDGNFVIYSSSGTPYWQSLSGGHPNQNYFGSDRMTGGQQFTQSYYMRSGDNRYAVLLQTDGNVVLYSAGYHPLWYTAPALGDTFTQQTDGNLVLYAIGTAKWQSLSGGNPGAYAVIQTDGNFIVYSSTNFPLWVSGTGGKI